MVIRALSIRLLCQLAKISRTQLFAEISSGRLLATKVGRRTCIRSEDLDTWLLANKKYETTRVLALQRAHPVFRLAYSISEFAQLTSLSCASVHREIESGRLLGTRVDDRRLIIPADAAEAWIKSLQTRKVS